MSELLDPHGILPKLQSGELQGLRQSAITQADICLRRLQYDRQLGEAAWAETDEGRIVGTAYHAGLAVFYEGRQKDVPPGWAGIRDATEAAFTEAMGDFSAWDTSEADARHRANDMVHRYFSEGHVWPPDYRVVAVEQTFCMPMPIEGWAAWGTFDLVLEPPDGGLTVVDHKTAKKRWRKDKHTARKNNQATWYRHWAAELYGVPEEHVEFYFDVLCFPDGPGKGHFERRLAAREGHEFSQLLLKAQSVCQLIPLMDGGWEAPPNTDSFLCDERWCDHWHRCPFGADLDGGVPVPLGSIVGGTSPTHEELS